MSDPDRKAEIESKEERDRREAEEILSVFNSVNVRTESDYDPDEFKDTDDDEPPNPSTSGTSIVPNTSLKDAEEILNIFNSVVRDDEEYDPDEFKDTTEEEDNADKGCSSIVPNTSLEDAEEILNIFNSVVREDEEYDPDEFKDTTEEEDNVEKSSSERPDLPKGKELYQQGMKEGESCPTGNVGGQEDANTGCSSIVPNTSLEDAEEILNIFNSVVRDDEEYDPDEFKDTTEEEDNVEKSSGEKPDLPKGKELYHQDIKNDEDYETDSSEEQVDDVRFQPSSSNVAGEVVDERVDWADVSEGYSSSSDSGSDDEDSDEEDNYYSKKDYPKIKFGSVSELDSLSCACLYSKTKLGNLDIMKTMLEMSPTPDNYVCVIDNVIRCYNHIFGNSNKVAGTYKVAFTDLFYRLRHELLFRCLCLAYNIPVCHSDIPFRQFGIDSDRTPDLIIEKDGTLIIIEVTAVSSIEKAAQSKGVDQMGFESKYSREIKLLTESGIRNMYCPFFFNMASPDGVILKEQDELMATLFHRNLVYHSTMRSFAKHLSILTINMKEKLVLPSTILFSNVSEIKQDHSDLSFLYKESRSAIKKNNYRELVISPYVYNKVSNDKKRFYWMLDTSKYTDNNNVVFVVNSMNHRITLEPSNKEGCKLNDMREFLNNNDMIGLLKYTKVRIGSTIVDSTQSDSGVKFYERVFEESKLIKHEDIPLVVSHSGALEHLNMTQDLDISNYKRKIMSYTKENYHSVDYDEKYEDVLIEAIVNFDRCQELETYGENTLPSALGCLVSSNIDIDTVMMSIEEKYIQTNSFTEGCLPVKIPKMKQPFVLPISNLNSDSYCKLEYKNKRFISNLIRLISTENPFTATILKLASEDNYNMYSQAKAPSKTLHDMMKERYDISNEINQLQKQLVRSSNSADKRLVKTADPSYSEPFNKFKARYKQINKEISQRKKTEGVGDNISYIRLACKDKKAPLRTLYKQEMKHFKDKTKQSTIEGVGIINNLKSDYDSDLNVFRSVCSMLIEHRGNNPDMILDEYVSEDARLVKELKIKSMSDYKVLIDSVRHSYLGHSSALISRLAHSLMFYSQLPFSSDYFRVDNLGYKNVLLFVRGGKKIFKSKSSKLYRLIYPISEELLPWYRSGHSNKGSFTVLNINGEYFGMTPWQMMHESVLTDSISFYSRVTSFVFLNLDPKIELSTQFHKVAVNVLLSYHNRRQTEVMLANMRYILLSTLGDFTGVAQILPEFFSFNYDRFQAFIRNSLLINYPSYFKQLQLLKSGKKSGFNDINISDFIEARLKNIFTLEPVLKIEDLALMIYSTFLMTKAPYQKLAERARNLKGILEIHGQYDKQVGLKITPQEQKESISAEIKNGDLGSYIEDLFSNDFKFDPKFCALVGNFTDSILINSGETEGIATEWINILNKTWDEMATSTGLRGRYEELEDFWGQKGYFVVYKDLLNRPGFPDKMNNLLNSGLDDDMKRRMMRELNVIFKGEMNDERDFLIFHAVDKVQWRGGREIYVMDINTKTLQQPIEKFMAYLCKKMDNELISIPSDKRAQVIHHSIFEKDLPLKDVLTWYLTLDCSKWAPKSVFVKFAVMILNMSCIPNSFKVHFLNYLSKLYRKRLYFNVGEVEVLKKNQEYSSVCEKYLIYDPHVKGYYIEMPYSWVMGIFNYTSSFMHAANQKYISYLLMKTSIISFKEETSLVMFAHSDDSGGRLCVPSFEMAKRAVFLYEVFVKSCNHLLSKKKSVISRIYFEILSVIYLFKKLLALLPKFLGGVRFLPTDKGPSQDLLQSYSKCIEVMVAGSDFSVAYIVMKVYSLLVWRFYFNRQPSKSDYDRPVQYLGMPDAHPLFVLLCGSDADILRLIRNGSDLGSITTFVNLMSKQMDTEGPIKPLKFEIKVKGIKKGFEDFIDTFSDNMELWSVRNVNYHNTVFNTLSFLRKLNDAGFVGSLVNESTTRRISRCYFIRSGDSAITRFGNIKLVNLLDSMNLFQGYRDKKSSLSHILNEILGKEAVKQIELEFQEGSDSSYRDINILKMTLSSPLRIYKYLDAMTLEGRNIIEMQRTLKPTLVQLVKGAKVFSVSFDPSCLVSYIKEPSTRWALPNLNGILTAEVELNKFLEKVGYRIEELNEDILLRICRTYGRENTKSIYLYSRIPGEIRQIKTYSAFLTFLSVNSFNGKEIQGLTLKLNEKDTGKEYVLPNIFEEVYLVNNIICLLMTFSEKCGVEFMNKVNYKSVEEISWVGGSLEEMLTHFRTLTDTDVRYNLISMKLEYLISVIRGENMRLDEGANYSYYTFLKSQRSRSGWYGKGEVYIRIEGDFYSFVIDNTTLELVYTNRGGKLPLHHSEYILDVLENIGVDVKSMKKPPGLSLNNSYFGWDNSGDLSVLKGREITSGIPAINLSKRNEFVDNLGFYSVHRSSGDYFILKGGSGDDVHYKKVYSLPIKKGELIGTIQRVIDPESFNEKIEHMGLGDFEEFVLTEILIDYGRELYVGFKDFIDNYAASKIYTIFRSVRDNGYSTLPNSIVYSPLPASQTSLVRILIDYTEGSGDKVIHISKNMDPVIMRLRSEYPEQVSTIVGERLVKYHNSIYSVTEKKEIDDSYDTLSREPNIELRRNALVKLMSYWGYGSLVNNIRSFTVSRSIGNYLFFNLTNLSKVSKSIYGNLFIDLVNIFNRLMTKWSPMVKSLDLPSNKLKHVTDINTFVYDNSYYISNSVYGKVRVGLLPNLYSMIYFNVFLGLLKEEDFVAELQSSLKGNYILSCLPIGWKYRFEIIATYNVLFDLWADIHKSNFTLDYYPKLQRFPDEEPHFKTRIVSTGVDFKPQDVYYNGFVTPELLSYILNFPEVEVKGVKYRLSNRISKPSNVDLSFNRRESMVAPFSDEFMNDDNFDDWRYENTMGDIDLEEIEIIEAEMTKNKYRPTTVRCLKTKHGNIITATVNWIISPNVGCSLGFFGKIRQVGENIVVLSDTYIPKFLDVFPNAGVRLVEFKRILRNRQKPIFAHYSFVNQINSPKLIENLLLGTEYRYPGPEESMIKCNYVRDIGEICPPSNLGTTDVISVMVGETEIIEGDGVFTYKKVKSKGKTKKGGSSTAEEGDGGKKIKKKNKKKKRVSKGNKETSKGKEVAGGSNEKGKDDSTSGSDTEWTSSSSDYEQTGGNKERVNSDMFMSGSPPDDEEQELKRMQKLDKEVDKLIKQNVLTEDSGRNLKSKYRKISSGSGLSLSTLLRSLLDESILSKLNDDILDNKMDLKFEDQKKMFLAPDYFSMAKGYSIANLKNIKDKKLRSELNSIHEDLAQKIGSNTLKLSKKFSKVVAFNFKFWMNTVRVSRVKIENKKFLITLMLAVCNNVILSESEEDDHMWQKMINNVGEYISEDEDSEDEDDFFKLIFDIVPNARLIYRPEGT